MRLTPKWIATTRFLWSWEKAVKEKDQKNEWMLKYNYLTEKNLCRLTVAVGVAYRECFLCEKQPGGTGLELLHCRDVLCASE